jgi:hypothetical protein
MTKTCGFHSYKELIATAIRSSYERQITLKQSSFYNIYMYKISLVYAWIEENVPHFQSLKGTESVKSWKVS